MTKHTHIRRLPFSSLKKKKSNLVTFNTQVKKEHFLCDLFSQKGDLVENSFGPGKKAVLSLYTSKCPISWYLFYN